MLKRTRNHGSGNEFNVINKQISQEREHGGYIYSVRHGGGHISQGGGLHGGSGGVHHGGSDGVHHRASGYGGSGGIPVVIPGGRHEIDIPKYRKNSRINGVRKYLSQGPPHGTGNQKPLAIGNGERHGTDLENL